MQVIAYWTLVSGYLIVLGIFCCIFAALFRKWYQTSPKYFSDLPFILAISFVFLTYDRIDSILGLTGIMPITTTTQLINLFAYVAFNGITLVLLLVIWLPDRKNLRNVIVIIWFALWISLISIFMGIMGSPDTLHSVIFALSLPMLLLLAITWFFSYSHKRLSVINPLLVGLGTTGMIIGMVVRIYVSLIGAPIGYVFTDLHWIAALIDIASYSIMFAGFSRKMSY